MEKDYIKVTNLTYKFNDFIALDNINFKIQKGDIIAIIGPNGSGKTTLLKNIIGIYKPNSGEITIAGKKPKEMIKKIGYVPQKFEFDRDIPITVYEFMALAKCNKTSHNKKNIKKMLELVGLKNVKQKILGTLSGGQFQRVMIARALLHEKQILIFDEPSTGIDIVGSETIYDLIKTINQEKHTTCLLVSHELNIVNKYADHVICLNKKMICFGTPKITITDKNLKKLYGVNFGLYHSHYNNKHY